MEVPNRKVSEAIKSKRLILHIGIASIVKLGTAFVFRQLVSSNL